MNEVINFLNKNYTIKKAAVLVNDRFNYEDLVDLLISTNLDDLQIVSIFNEDRLECFERFLQKDKFEDRFRTPESVKFISLFDFKGMEGDWALCAKDIYPNLLLKFIPYHPRYLAVEICEDRVTAFRLWEEYRTIAERIVIVTHRENKADQVLDWSKNEDNDIELSVIFPMYNVEKYLDQCIESVIQWKAPYVEYLFVNDGSPDNSREVVLKWAEKDNRIKLLDKENGGCASAREYGLEHAKGNYIGFIDPDDFIDPSMFRKLFKAATTGSYEISYCGYNEYYENNGEIKRVNDALGHPYNEGVTDPDIIQDLIPFCRVAIWRGIYKSEMLEKNNIHFYTDLRRFDDLPFKVETFAMAKSVIAIPEHLYYYRLARPGQDVFADDDRLYVHFDIFKYLNKSIAAKYDRKLTDRLQVCKLQTHLYALSKIKEQYLDHYLKMARQDLLSTGKSKERSVKMIMNMLGKENAEAYVEILNQNRNFFLNDRSRNERH